MNIDVLIESVVRQMTELLGQLATAKGQRASLIHLADRVFLQLAEQLSQAGVSRKVCADMFGLTLRSYLRKIRRLSESSTERGRSLWESVLTFLSTADFRSRTEVLSHFHQDDPELLAGVLHDLLESGLAVRNGGGTAVTYRVADRRELETIVGTDQGETLDPVVWAFVYRLGPISLPSLKDRIPSGGVERALTRLMAQGKVQRLEQAEVVYQAQEFSLPQGAVQGWEAAVFDHIQAMVRTVTARLQGRSPVGTTGGSTYSFEVWPGHPLEQEVLQQLEDFRARTSDLRSRVREYNQRTAKPAQTQEVTVYGGQLVVDSQSKKEEDSTNGEGKEAVCA